MEEENKTEIIGAFRTTPTIRRALYAYQRELERAGYHGISLGTVLNKVLAEWLSGHVREGDNAKRSE